MFLPNWRVYTVCAVEIAGRQCVVLLLLSYRTTTWVRELLKEREAEGPEGQDKKSQKYFHTQLV